jgi:ABC-type uncharacterized transport system substrate-binding protein
MSSRRKLIIALGAVALTAPLGSLAQSQRAEVYRIGLLSPFPPADTVLRHQAFRLGLHDLGWIEGKNISIEYRHADGRFARLPGLATDLVRLEADVIVTANAADTLAAHEATRLIPIVMASDPLFSQQFRQIAELALKHRLLSASQSREYAEAGGLIGYGANSADMHRRAAAYVDKIFKGAKPGYLPIEQPNQFELVINMKNTTALGIEIPQSMLAQATKVIE